MEKSNYINYILITLLVLISASFTAFLIKNNVISPKLLSASVWIGLVLFTLFFILILYRYFYITSNSKEVI
jgi:hypothetical protein